jgi:hypothetical protein
MTAADDIESLEREMRPGKCSVGGFLGPTESLARVIADDERTLARLGIPHELIADSIEQIWSAAWKEMHSLPFEEMRKRSTDFPTLHRPESIPRFSSDRLPDPGLGCRIGEIRVFFVQYRGFQICPWGCGAFGGADFMMLNRTTGESFCAPDLIIHLIRAHHFFEGRQSPYRVDPEKVIRTLEIRPSENDSGSFRPLI